MEDFWDRVILTANITEVLQELDAAKELDHVAVGECTVCDIIQSLRREIRRYSRTLRRIQPKGILAS